MDAEYQDADVGYGIGYRYGTQNIYRISCFCVSVWKCNPKPFPITVVLGCSEGYRDAKDPHMDQRSCFSFLVHLVSICIAVRDS